MPADDVRADPAARVSEEAPEIRGGLEREIPSFSILRQIIHFGPRGGPVSWA